jgi:hypothetical protein
MSEIEVVPASAETWAGGARVIDLRPGDEVRLSGVQAVYIGRTAHPLWPALELVVWRMGDGSVSFDALNAVQEIGEMLMVSRPQRLERLRKALAES